MVAFVLDRSINELSSFKNNDRCLLSNLDMVIVSTIIKC